MHPEPEEVDDGGHDDERKRSGSKVLREAFLHAQRSRSAHRERMGSGGKSTHDTEPSAHVEKLPQVQDDGEADRHEGEESDHFAGNGQTEKHACQSHPCPPWSRELAVRDSAPPSLRSARALHI